MDEFLYVLKLYEDMGWEIFREEGIDPVEVEQALIGLGGIDPRFYPLEASDPMTAKRTWDAFGILVAVREARRLYREGEYPPAMADMFRAGIAYQLAVVGLKFPEIRNKLDRPRRSLGGKESGNTRRDNNKERDEKIIKMGKDLLAAGKAMHEICSIIADRPVAKGLKAQSVRKVLKRAGIYLPRKKRE